jgi:hypothetical protein
MQADQGMRELSRQKIVAPDSVLVRELSGEAVLLDLNSEMYFGLDEVGYRVWTALTSSERVSGAFEALLCEYEVDPEQLRESLESFVGECVGQGLLQVVPAS